MEEFFNLLIVLEGCLIKKNNILVASILLVLIAAVGYVNIFADNYQAVMKRHGYSKINRIKQAESEQIIRVYQTANSEIVQIVSVKGYKSFIESLVSIKDGNVNKVIILNHDETPDYGGYIEEEWFLSRLYLPILPKLNVVKITKENSNDVVAVTGATISSRGVVAGVNLCIENYGGLMNEK